MRACPGHQTAFLRITLRKRKTADNGEYEGIKKPARKTNNPADCQRTPMNGNGLKQQKTGRFGPVSVVYEGR